MNKQYKYCISYRRIDCATHVGLLKNIIDHRFGADSTFVDVENIEPGTDFVKCLRESVRLCDSLLVLIGEKWLKASKHGYGNSLFDPDDYVHFEIETALHSGISIIPILFENAAMPAESQLPSDIRQFSRIQAFKLIPGELFQHRLNTLLKILSSTPAHLEACSDFFPEPPLDTTIVLSDYNRDQTVEPDYQLDTWFVANEEYAEFLSDKKNAYWKKGGKCLSDHKVTARYLDSWENESWDILSELPVTHVSYFAAAAYAEWRGRSLGRSCTIPNYGQWSKAAICGRGERWLREEINAGNVNFGGILNKIRGLSKDLKRNIHNPWGYIDLVGNLFNLCAPDKHEGSNARAVGGAFYTKENDLLEPLTISPYECRSDTGFRCVTYLPIAK